MKVLIIEDDPNKLAQIEGVLRERISNVSCSSAYSYRSGLKAILDADWDWIILDMSLPTYDVATGEDGLPFRAFGGRDLLSEMTRRRRLFKTVLLTQFEAFGSGSEQITLKELTVRLQSEFPNIFRGSIYYNAAEVDWRRELVERLCSDEDSHCRG